MQPSMHTTPAETAPLGTTSTLGTQSHQSGATTEATPRYTSSTTHPTDTTSSYTSGNGLSSESNYTTGANTGSTTTSSTTAGPHKSNMANKLDPRVDSDLDGSKTAPGGGQSSHSHGTTGTTGSYPGSTTAGYTSTGSTTGNTRVGPHGTDTANKVDPRVDSDLDRNRTTGYNTTTGPSTTGTTTTPHTTHTSNTRVGPHGSDMANKADPRVDSDLDNTRTGHHGTTGTGPSYGSTTTTGHGTTTGTTGHTGNTRVGPHDSNMANKADPRVDSDLDNTRTGHHGTTTSHGHSTTGQTHGTSTYPTHNTTSGTATATAAGVGGTTNLSTGPAPKTAGPHKSDLMNKLDPRVDSNRDGSKTLGADKGASGNQ